MTEKLIEQYVWTTTPESVLRRAEVVEFCNFHHARRIQDVEVKLKDGSKLTGIDRVVLYTGYLYSLPFLTHVIDYRGRQLHNLHLDVFYIHDQTLTLVGIPHDIATFRLFDFQASAIAAVLSDCVALPSLQSMLSMYQERQKHSNMGKAFHSYGFRKELAYIRQVADSWSRSSTVQAVARAYEKELQEAQDGALEMFRARLLATTLFRNQSRAQTRDMIDAKTKALEAELKELESAGKGVSTGLPGVNYE